MASEKKGKAAPAKKKASKAVKKTAKKKPIAKRIRNGYSEKKEMAKLLFTTDSLSFATIAERVGVNVKTVSVWAQEGKWENYKQNLILTKDAQLNFFIEQLNSLNNKIRLRPEGDRFSTPAEADIFTKLTACIKNLMTETGIGQIIEVAKLFIDSLPETENELITTVTKYFDVLIKDKLKKR